MKVSATEPPREFTVGRDRSITLRDTGAITLEENELVTFHTSDKGPKGGPTKFDVTRTPFGYYATNSLNGTLPANGLRPALARNSESQRLFLLLVEPAKIETYKAYLAAEAMDHLGWLDTLEAASLLPKEP